MSETPGTVGQKVFKGTLWTVAMRMSIRFIGIISVIILARILDPADFGLVAKAVMIQSFLELITALGLEAALIRDQEADESHYNTAWTLHIIRGSLIGLVLAIFANPISIYLKSPELELIIYCYAFVSFLSGFYNIHVVDFRKQLNFSLDFKFNLYKKLAGFIATITIAYIWETYWALVAGVMVSSLVSVVSSFIMCPQSTKLDLASWRPLFHFSKWMLGYELMGAISSKIDTFVLSRFSTTQNVGLYTVSYEVAGTASTEIAMPVARALMPGLSTLNADRERFKDLYVSSISLVLLIAVPAAVGLSTLSYHVTLTLLGEKWIEAASIIHILALYGIPRTINATAVSALVAYGRVDVLTKTVVVLSGIKILAVSMGVYLNGLYGVIWGVLFTGVIGGLLMLIVQERLGILSIKFLVKKCWRVIISTAGMSVFLNYYLESFNLIGETPIALQLLLEIVIGALVYIVFLFLLSNIGDAEDTPEMKAYCLVRDKLTSKVS